jgi:hypothetical protein
MSHPDVDPSFAAMAPPRKKGSAEIRVSILAAHDAANLDGLDSGKGFGGGFDNGFDV